MFTERRYPNGDALVPSLAGGVPVATLLGGVLKNEKGV
jgi:hypothetical protein